MDVANERRERKSVSHYLFKSIRNPDFIEPYQMFLEPGGGGIKVHQHSDIIATAAFLFIFFR